MSLFAIVSAILVAGVCGGLFLFSKAQIAYSCSQASKKPTIVAFGDSLVEGYGAPSGGDFVTKLSGRIGLPITNLGKNGDTTEQGLARVESVLAKNPDIVFVLLGGNDALQKVPKETTQRNLDRILTTLESYQSKKIHIVLVGVLGGFPTDPFADMYKALAKDHGATYVPNILSGLIGNQTYMSDQVHPNAIGYEKIAERLEPVLNSVCKEYADNK